MQGLLRCCPFVNNGHQDTGDIYRKWVLNYITPVDDPACALLHESMRTFNDDFI